MALIKAWIFAVNGLIMLTSIMLTLYLPKYPVFREHIKSAYISFFSDCNVLDKAEYLTPDLVKRSIFLIILHIPLYVNAVVYVDVIVRLVDHHCELLHVFETKTENVHGLFMDILPQRHQSLTE